MAAFLAWCTARYLLGVVCALGVLVLVSLLVVVLCVNLLFEKLIRRMKP